MKRKIWLFTMLLPALMLVAVLVVGERQAVAQAVAQASEVAPQDGQIFGSELMTFGERLGYRFRMWSARSEEERQRIRNEHHKQMLERARERNIFLPEEVPAKPGRALGRDPETHPGRGLGPDGEGPPGAQRGGPPGYGR